ncbi:DUF3488 and transglutaminase-like domain-containing protein [Aquabacterium sp. J223]|uniref:transglutaminase family protein n=1 Tax=Aquabacterium sp. J223 TaxID=2898431 RepID=UPI0021AD9AF5|nr:DUF3488 and transglutaminase-like domain-containing protein [Aquabacterium sp. J223]UUX94925.1 DUF3488 and transglutaminase-like domain-containing protein [Aquabacterium sp. J223]
MRLRLRRLPRDTRDTLFLLGVITWTILPHLAHLPLWCAALSAVVLLWRGRLALAQAPLPSRWAVIAVLTVAAGLTLITEQTLLGKEAGVTMLVLLMVLKTLELRARRDALVVFFLGFFLVLTHFLYSQSLAVAAAMLVSVWALLTALVLAHMPVGRPALKDAAALAAKAALLGLPLMVALFLLFPRIGPLWGLPQDALGKTGLSGSLKLGGVAQLATDDTPAFRIRFEGPPPPPQSLYFRGPVLTDFDGDEWRASPLLRHSWQPPRLQPFGPARRYELMLEPSRLAMLPLLEATVAVEPEGLAQAGLRAVLRHDLQWLTDRPVNDRLRLQASAHPRWRLDEPGDALSLRRHVELPPGHNPRMLAWALALRRQPAFANADADTLAAHLLDLIRNGGYTYTLAPGVYEENAVDAFWFDRKLGFCEHYAVAFVVALRALDVPARIVTGYQGTDPTPVDGWWVVRQSHAHAWAEYWQPGRGWTRADPTAAVAPERVVRSQALQPAPGLVAGALGQVSPELLARLRRQWERMNQGWNQWVLNYSRSSQFALLERLGVSAPDWTDLSRVLIGLLSAASAAAAGWALWDRHRQDPWQRLLARVRRALARRGLQPLPSDGPRRLAERLEAAHGPEAAGPAARALRELDALRYGRDGRRRPPAGWFSSFRRRLPSA